MTNKGADEDKISFLPSVPIKEGRASSFGDGIADITIGGVKAYFEVFINSPFRILGRTIDGFAQGSKKGMKGAVSGLLGGTMKGVLTSLNKVGEAWQDMSQGYQKLSSAIIAKEEQ